MMTTLSKTANYREYKIPQPPALVSSYALKSTASHIAAAKLSMDVLRLSKNWSLKIEQNQKHQRTTLPAQIVEELYLGTLKELLRWENERPSNPQECCLPFVDVALDAGAQTILEIIASGSSGLWPTATQLYATFRKAAPNDEDRHVVKVYYRNYVKRLVLFCLTQYADLDIGPSSYFQTLAQRNLYFLSTTYPCESDVAKLDIPPLGQPIHMASLEEAVDRTRGVADKIRAMAFVSGLTFPKLIKKTILCGSENSGHPAKGDRNIIFLNGDSPDRNVIFRIDKIERGIGAPLATMSQDLVEVATYVFTGDLLVRRSARWRRSLNFVIPVRNPRRWRSIAEDLSMITSFISGDHISFEFTQRQIEEEKQDSKDKPVSGDCVCLLSGGLDSFAGSLELLQNGRQPVLIGHFKQGHVAKRQRLVADALKESFDTENKKLIALRLDVGLAPGRERYEFKGKLEHTQRLRSFLFLSLATAVADGLGLHEIFIPENGVLAFNVPLAACRTGSRSTRSAHPRFLWFFEQTINKLYDRKFKVRNPLVFKTKAEVLKVFKGTGVEAGLAKSVSCSRYSYGVMMDKRRGKRKCTHCGTCLACLIRRAAMVKAGFGNQDAKYIIQPFKKLPPTKPVPPESPYLKEGEWLNILHLVDFCNTISNASEDQILLLHPQLCLPNQYFPDAPKGCNAAFEAARMYRRFANEIIRVVKETAKSKGKTTSPLLKICGFA